MIPGVTRPQRQLVRYASIRVTPASGRSIDVEKLVEGEQHVAEVGERVRAVAGREERDGGGQLVVARRAAQRELVGAADSRPPACGPDSAAARRARSAAQSRTNGSFSSARFWVGTAVVFRRPHAAVESGASNTSASGFGTERLMNA